MNNIIASILLSVFVMMSSYATASDLQHEVNGYRWGDSASKYKGLSKLGDDGDVSYYTKSGEVYTVGSVSVKEIIYGFYKDQLFGVYLNIYSNEIYDKLLVHMKSQYGLPSYQTTVNKLLVSKWKLQDVKIKLKNSQLTQKMKLAFYYQPISSKLNAKQWEDLDTSSFRFVPIEKDKRPERFILFEF